MQIPVFGQGQAIPSGESYTLLGAIQNQRRKEPAGEKRVVPRITELTIRIRHASAWYCPNPTGLRSPNSVIQVHDQKPKELTLRTWAENK